MQIIKIHYKISKPVERYSEIAKDAENLKQFIVSGPFKGLWRKAYGLAHCQVSESPMAFFVLIPELVEVFGSQVIINPEIVNAPIKVSAGAFQEIPNANEFQEGCMSFPYRHMKRMIRFNIIDVRYQIKGVFGFKTIEKRLEGQESQMFQHEYDHLQGKNIFFESEKPWKWWEVSEVASAGQLRENTDNNF